MFGEKATGPGDEAEFCSRQYVLQLQRMSVRSPNVILFRGATKVMTSEDRNARRLMVQLVSIQLSGRYGLVSPWSALKSKRAILHWIAGGPATSAAGGRLVLLLCGLV